MAIELVVGLGNPGAQYADTRHNIGFAVVDEVGRRLRAGAWSHRHRSEVATTARGRRLWLAKPATFMNRSGDAVRVLLASFDLRPASMLVVVDDVDLPLGRLRLRRSGGPGTHNGMRDVVATVGSGFPRLRLGIRGADASGDLADYVLAPFAPAEEPLVAEMVQAAADAVEAVVFTGLGAAMNRFNRLMPDPADER